MFGTVPVAVGLVLLDLDHQDTASEKLLAPDERKRASSFRFPLHRNRYVRGRTALRRTLGTRLDLPPAAVPLIYGPWGKPALAPPHRLSFNLSHSGGVGLLAVVEGDYLLGVDVEEALAENAEVAIARRFFAPGEVAGNLAVAAGPDRVDSFFRIWTRKESFLKAHGAGLAVPLNAFEVAHRRDDPVQVISCRADLGRPDDWQLLDLTETLGARGVSHRAALAIRTTEPLQITSFSQGEQR